MRFPSSAIAGIAVLGIACSPVERQSASPQEARLPEASPSDADPSDASEPVVPAGTRIVTYDCGATELQVTFRSDPDQAEVRIDGGEPILLTGQRPASGIWYAAGGFELRGKGREVKWSSPGEPTLDCTAASD